MTAERPTPADTTATPNAQGEVGRKPGRVFRCDRNKYTYKIPTNDCLNKTHTMTSPADMPTWMGDFLPLDNELQAIDRAERGRNLSFPQGQAL